VVGVKAALVQHLDHLVVSVAGKVVGLPHISGTSVLIGDATKLPDGSHPP
jgi:hypothetical protein